MDHKLCLPGALHTVGIPHGLITCPSPSGSERPEICLPATLAPAQAQVATLARHFLSQGASDRSHSMCTESPTMCSIRVCLTAPFFSYTGSGTQRGRERAATYRWETEAQKGKPMAQSHTVGPQQGQPQIQPSLPIEDRLSLLWLHQSLFHAHRWCALTISHVLSLC